MGHLCAARPTPRSPKVDKYGFASVGLEVDGISFEIGKLSAVVKLLVGEVWYLDAGLHQTCGEQDRLQGPLNHREKA